MKKTLSQWLLNVAKKLDPKGVIENVPEVRNYKPSKLGLAIIIDKKDIKKFKATEKVSQREAVRQMICESKSKIKSEILTAINSNKLIEYDVQKKGKDYVVGGELKIYRQE